MCFENMLPPADYSLVRKANWKGPHAQAQMPLLGWQANEKKSSLPKGRRGSLVDKHIQGAPPPKKKKKKNGQPMWTKFYKIYGYHELE